MTSYCLVPLMSQFSMSRFPMSQYLDITVCRCTRKTKEH